MVSISTKRSPVSLGTCCLFSPTLSGKLLPALSLDRTWELLDVLEAPRLLHTQVTMDFTTV